MSTDAEKHRDIVVAGAARTIEYAIAANGSKPAKKFLEEELDNKERAKIVALLRVMANQGNIPNTEQFKKVRGEIFEFKKHQIRIFCFREGTNWLLTNGYRKKKDRLNPNEIERAERIMAEHRKGYAREK